jgi:hypothetical protein
MNEKHYHSFDVTFVIFFDDENDIAYYSGNDWKSRQEPGLLPETWVGDYKKCYPNVIHMTNIVKANNLFIFFKYGFTKFSDGFDIEDLKDELGLGCNDHPPAKPATDKDFEVRLYAWIARQNRIPSFNECVKWWNSIPHSCKQTTVESKCTNVLKQIKTNNSMESIDKKEAEERAKKILNVDNKTKVIAINNKRSTYIERSFIQALEAVSKGLEVKAVGFLDGVPADEADKARKELHKSVAKMNKLFRCYAQKYNEDPTFELISMEGFMPQMIEIEPTDALV